ncbi:hypothetical protein HNY73_022784 [Argiope bruennichi]|uniref:Uncharacterized protein n=1 Tax=Argiope bruennichi TaxID=94029 RepID=A0A8T0E690_ARGBR|nr:hypothetical protein HNY73_022784 [Argiope bruennichi]
MPVSDCQRLPESPDAGRILEETHTNSEKTFSLFGTSEKKENASRAGLRANSVPPLRRNTRSGGRYQIKNVRRIRRHFSQLVAHHQFESPYPVDALCFSPGRSFELRRQNILGAVDTIWYPHVAYLAWCNHKDNETGRSEDHVDKSQVSYTD